MTDRAIIDQANQLQKVYNAALDYKKEKKEGEAGIRSRIAVSKHEKDYRKEVDVYIKMAAENKISPRCTFSILTSISAEVLHE